MTQPPVHNDEAMAELTARARSISHDAGTKVTSAFRDMISAGAGLAGFAVESAKDLVQYMVRRGQMSADEAEKLVKEAEAAHLKRPKAERDRLAASRVAAEKAAADKKAARLAAETALPANKPLSKTVKTAPLRPIPAPALAAPEPAKPVAKAAAPAKAASATKNVAPTKPLKAAKAPVKASPKTAKAPAKKAAAKPAPKKAVKKKK
jgi:polyhydroxyalkanoate synthesis regulator phasin